LLETLEKIKEWLLAEYNAELSLFKFTIIYEKCNMEIMNIVSAMFLKCARIDFVSSKMMNRMFLNKIKPAKSGECKSGANSFANSKSNKKSISVNLGCEVDLEMIYIPAGKFDMGNNDGRDASPIHQVTLSKDFYMGKYLVTQEQWIEIMKTNPSQFNKEGGNHPVENLSWEDCRTFIKKLNALKLTEGKFRLPTEAEWEYACRAGSKTRYYWGDVIDDEYFWYCGNSNNSTQAVGKRKKNAFGLYDMSGNVWEWCHDYYDKNYYQNSVKLNPKGSAASSDHVIRGGGYYSGADYCTSSFRYYSDLSPCDYNLGFRLALSPGR